MDTAAQLKEALAVYGEDEGVALFWLLRAAQAAGFPAEEIARGARVGTRTDEQVAEDAGRARAICARATGGIDGCPGLD